MLYVLDGLPTDVILGMDFLKRYNPSISWVDSLVGMPFLADTDAVCMCVCVCVQVTDDNKSLGKESKKPDSDKSEGGKVDKGKEKSEGVMR